MDKKKSSMILKIVFIVVMIVVSYFSMTNANFGLNVAYFLIGLAVVSTIVFSLFQMAQSPKAGLMSVLGLVVLVVAFLVAYSMADGELTSNGMVTTETSKFVGGSLGMLYILGGLTLAVTVVGEVWSMIK